MQRVWVVVDGQGVFLALNRELALGNTVGVPAGNAAKIGVLGFVILEIIKTKRHIGHVAVTIRGLDRSDDAGIGDDLHL